MTENKALATTEAKPSNNFSLAKWPENEYNRLVPTQTIMTTDLLMPIVQVVIADIEDDTYTSNDVPNGKRAPGARLLNKFANAASVSFLDERRVDDGTNPNLIRVTVTAAMTLPTGQRITATGTKEVDITRLKMSPAQEGKFRSFFYEHVSTRARNRAIRALLSLKSSYTLEELRKPFAVVTYVPNTSHPDVRAAMLQAMSGSVPALYGPEPAKAIGPGAADLQAPEAPDDDDVTEGQFSEQAPMPDWMSGTSAKAAPAAPARHRLLAMLQDNVSASALEGDATPTQLAELGDLIGPFGPESLFAIVGHAWGTKAQPADEHHKRDFVTFTAAQAAAIIAVSKALPVPEFRSLWIELGQIAAAKGGQQ